MVVAGEFHSLAPARILCLLLACWCFQRIFAEPGKFGSPSGGALTVSFRLNRRKSASGRARSVVPRVTHCMASETLVDCFVCWNSAHLCDHFIGHCSCDSHHDDFLHCFLGSQPLLGWDRHILCFGECVAYFDSCFCCDPLRVTSAVCCEQHLLHQPSNLLCP